MGKERKITMGKSLSSGKLGSSLGGTTSNSSTSYMSCTSKVLMPSAYDLPPADTRRIRKITDTSAWTPGMIYVRDFQTQNHDSYVDPQEHLKALDAEDDLEEAKRNQGDKRRQEKRMEAVEKLGNIARTKFGSMTNMLKAFKKNTGDTITLPEFAEHLRRRNMDQLMPVEEQELVFEQLKASARGSISAGNLSKTVDESVAPADKSSDAYMMREFLAQQLKEHRKETEENGADSNHAVVGTADQMKKATGMKTFDLDVGAEEMDHVVEEMFKKKHTLQSHNKFSRYLRMTNVKLHAIPFYDMRQDDLDLLKKRAKALGEQAADPNISGKLKTLKDKRRSEIENDLKVGLESRHLLQQADAAKYSLTKEQPGLFSPVKPGSRIHSASTPNLHQHQPTSPHGHGHGHGDSGQGQGQPHSLDESFDSQGFGTGTGTGGDWGSSGGVDAGDSIAESAATAIFGESDASMYNSTYSEYYPPLKYEVNKPITRDIISDADLRVKLRNQRRAVRHQRTVNNLNVTQERLEREKLDKQSRAIRREQTMTEDMIRYKTEVFLHDLKCYKKQPLQTMARKPNLTKSDQMWGGQMSFDSRGGEESRDFQSTFKGSFVEPPTQQQPTLDLDRRISQIFNE